MLVMAFYAPFAMTNMQDIRESMRLSLFPVLIDLPYLYLAKKY